MMLSSNAAAKPVRRVPTSAKRRMSGVDGVEGAGDEQLRRRRGVGELDRRIRHRSPHIRRKTEQQGSSAGRLALHLRRGIAKISIVKDTFLHPPNHRHGTFSGDTSADWFSPVGGGLPTRLVGTPRRRPVLACRTNRPSFLLRSPPIQTGTAIRIRHRAHLPERKDDYRARRSAAASELAPPPTLPRARRGATDSIDAVAQPLYRTLLHASSLRSRIASCPGGRSSPFSSLFWRRRIVSI